MSFRHRVAYNSVSDADSVSSDGSVSRDGMVVGDNGDLEHETTGCLGLDLSFKLVRGLDETKISTMVDKIVETEDVKQIVDLFVLMFSTRNCRGGKGERDLFAHMFLSLYRHFPVTCRSLLSIVPSFGRWEDLILIAEKSSKMGTVSGCEFKDFSTYTPNRSERSTKEYLKDITLKELGKQIGKDWKIQQAGDTSTEKISLAAKWAPREGGAFQKRNSMAYDAFVEAVLSEVASTSDEHKEKQVRKIVSSLTSALDVAEVKMCDGRYSEIDYTKIPSNSLNKFRKAHLNELLPKDRKAVNAERGGLRRAGRGSFGRGTPSDPRLGRGRGIGRSMMRNLVPDTGDRFPDNPDRVEGRKHLLAATREGKVKGGQMQPHHIAEKFLFQYSSNSWRFESFESSLSSSEKEVLEAQWKDLSIRVASKTKGSFIPVADVSGSMGNEGGSAVKPISVCVAMSILLSEVTHEAFRDRILTFSGEPSWVNFAPGDSLEEKVKKTIADCSDAQNTNLVATFKLIIDEAKRFNLKSEDLPDLVIFSDMQFDSAISTSRYGYSQSTFTTIDRMFADAGLTRPRIVYWNLNTPAGTPVKGNEPNTVLMSGYSPSLFKYLAFGDEVKEITPLTVYRSMIDDKMYDSVRNLLSSSNEGILSSYTFTPTEEEELVRVIEIPSESTVIHTTVDSAISSIICGVDNQKVSDVSV